MEHMSYAVISGAEEAYVFCNGKITDPELEPEPDITGPGMKMTVSSNLPQEEILSCFTFERVTEDNPDFRANYIKALFGEAEDWELMLVKPITSDSLWLNFGNKKFYKNRSEQPYYKESVIFSWAEGQEREKDDYIKLTFELEAADNKGRTVSFSFLSEGLCTIETKTPTEYRKIHLPGYEVPSIGRLIFVEKNVC